MAKAKKDTAQVTKRPEYDRAAIMALVCGLMAEGQSLRRICASVPDMPKHSTILSWLEEDTSLADQYSRARAHLTDVRFEQFRDASQEIIARYIAEGWEPKDAVAAAKLECANMQWEISKLNPKKYGDKIEQTLQNPDGSALTIQVVKFGDSQTPE